MFAGAFYGVGKLRALDLYDNELRSLDDGTFLGLEELQQLDVGSNQLVEVAARSLAPVCRFLEDLNLSKNKLQMIDFQSLAELDRLTFVDLANNSWTCDCALWLAADVGGEALKSARDHIVCEQPPAARGKLFSYVMDRNVTKNCSPCTEQPTPPPPLDFVDRWLVFSAVVVAAILVSSVALTVTLCRTVCRTRRRGSWSPCHDKDNSAGSSDQKFDGVVV